METASPVVVIIEDLPVWQGLLEEVVTELGFPVVIIQSLTEFKTFLSNQDNSNEPHKVKAFIVDGALSEDASGTEDGEYVSAMVRLRPRYEETALIGNSTNRNIPWADHNLRKSPTFFRDIEGMLTRRPKIS